MAIFFQSEGYAQFVIKLYRREVFALRAPIMDDMMTTRSLGFGISYEKRRGGTSYLVLFDKVCVVRHGNRTLQEL